MSDDPTRPRRGHRFAPPMAGLDARRGGDPDLFVSAKCAAPIPARHPALRAALVRASLDPEIRLISHVRAARVGGSPADLDVVVVDRQDGRFGLDVVSARDEAGRERQAIETLGIGLLAVTAAELEAEPMRSNRDLVWSHRGRPVPFDLRLQILRALADDGPMPLDRLLGSLVCVRDPAAAVLSLCCDDLLALDLETGPIGPSTLVRSRT